MTQVGSMIMMALLLTSAALLALSNAKASKMVVNGVAVEVAESQPNPATPTAPEVFGGSNNAAAGRPAHPAPPTAHSRPPDGRVVRVASDTSSSATSRYQGPARQNRSRPVVDRVGVNPESQAEMGYGGPAN
ncbi:uncharacterized protein P884DRAFT_255009 [Thermothelomyces heterothallicus CBS 202.75]|uniref:uncharacterized protein n=1 Tax=Thermothelomyces heterothallicus CBS 202.75 TaxID=1149848 RepID=UPI0037434028